MDVIHATAVCAVVQQQIPVWWKRRCHVMGAKMVTSFCWHDKPIIYQAGVFSTCHSTLYLYLKIFIISQLNIKLKIPLFKEIRTKMYRIPKCIACVCEMRKDIFNRIVLLKLKLMIGRWLKITSFIIQRLQGFYIINGIVLNICIPIIF